MVQGRFRGSAEEGVEPIAGRLETEALALPTREGDVDAGAVFEAGIESQKVTTQA
jgi:hypothetical protein